MLILPALNFVRMFTLFKKEINGFLNSLIGYIVMIVFLLMTGLFLWVFPLEFNVLDFGFAGLDGLFIIAPFVFLFLIPAITMRSFADEKKSGATEAILVGKAFVKGRGVVLAVMEPNFLMGSMGAVVGEKFCAAVDKAIEEKIPLVAICCSGGARMHEGVVSLGQMAKTSAAVAMLDKAGGLFISVLTDPTTGGVTASFAMLGDCLIAEPRALIGFAGPRTIAETIKVELPEGFQTAEFMLEHGFIDMIVHRKDLRSEIARIIDYCQK